MAHVLECRLSPAIHHQSISTDRFAALLSYFHVAPLQRNDQEDDPLSRIRPFITHLNHVLGRYYAPSQYLTIDETMVAFKGRADIKQYIPSKPHKWGYKVYCLASDNYLLRFEIYEGKDEQPSAHGPVHDLVMRLTTPYQNQRFILFTDSWFTSPTLLSSLVQHAIYCCGSVRRNRKGMPDIDEREVKDMRRGEWIRRTQGTKTLIVWKDQKALYLLFNHISSAHTGSLQRWNGGGNRVNLGCPKAVQDYFFKARSVDVVGQLHYSYTIGRKSKKPWFRLAWWLIDMCIVNAFQLWSKANPGQTQLLFREKLMYTLAGIFGANQHALEISRGPHVVAALAKDHYPEHTGTQRDCVVCSERPHARRTSVYICHACNVHLCIGKCFSQHHSRV